MADEQPPPAGDIPDPQAATPDAAEPIAGADPHAADAQAADPLGLGDLTAADPGALVDQSAIDELLKQANFEDPIGLPDDGAGPLPGAATDVAASPGQAFPMPNFQQVMADAQVSSIDLLRDVELNVKIELGRSRMLVEDVLKLGEGSVVELDKLAGDPVDVFVNDRLVARGEVLVLNDNFCVRVNEIVAGVKEEGL